MEALYDGWDTEGDCWRGSYKQEYSYKENWSSNAWYNGWDYTNHTWIGAEKTETVTEYSEKGYVRQDIQSEWDMDSLDWSLAYKNEDAYIYVNDTVYYGDDNYYINTRSYKVYTSQYKGDGGLWFGESKTEYQYDEAMRKKAEVYYQGMISETEWQPHERCEYEYDMYDNISVENRLSYNMYDDLWVLENTTKYYYTKGVNVLDESEWILLRDIYADLSRRNGWKRQWYDCSNINSVYSWSGVTRSDGHVTKIDISGFKLGGSFPYRLFTLPYLQEINISNNHFTGDLSVEFTDSIDSNHISVKNISTLYMANNGFEGNVSGFVYYLPSLKTLNLSGNRFSDVYPELPMSINSLNIGKQKIDRTLELHLSHPDLESIIADIPSIILYDHASQSYSPYIDLMCRTKNNEIGQSDWFIQMTIDNGIVTFPNVSYDNAYRGKSGDTLDVEALEDGSSFKLKLDFDSGDANLTDGVDAADLQATVLYAFNAYQYRPFNFTAADTYKDGNINVQDVVCTVNILLGQIDRLVPPQGNIGQVGHRAVGESVLFACGHGQQERLDKALHGLRRLAFQMLRQLPHIDGGIAVEGGRVEFHSSQVPRARMLLRGTVIYRGKIVVFIVDFMGGNAVGNLGGSIIIERGVTGHHAAEETDVETVLNSGQGLLDEALDFLVLDRLRIESLLLDLFGKFREFRIREENQRIVRELVTDRLGTGGRLFFLATAGDECVLEDFHDLLRAKTEPHTEVVHLKAHGSLPGLRAHAGARHASDHAGFGTARVVAVQARDGKGLQNVKFNDHGVEPL